MNHHPRPRPRFRTPVLLVSAALGLAGWGGPSPGQEPPRFASTGVRLPADQLQYDAGFELLDFNGDGKLDLFLPNTSFMSFAAHLNEGTREEPRFGHAVGYPVNLTETEFQTIEHCQAFAVCDLNGDGLFDLVAFDGELRMIFNVGTKHGPNHWHLPRTPPHFFPGTERMVRENARIVTGPESMYWNKGIFARQVLTLTVADWDGDGLEDLLVCRFKDEAPGVKPTGGAELWTGRGRVVANRPANPPPPPGGPTFLGKLAQAPPRGLYFYKNLGTREKPWFDKGVEILTPDGKSIAAPNPVVADLDGDGVPDLVSTEAEYSCNSFRVDWPTEPSVTWYHRRARGDVAVLEPGRPVTDAAGRPVPGGVQARLADFRGVGVKDLFVMDGGNKSDLRWYRNMARSAAERPAFAPPVVLRGTDFGRFDFMYQPLVVDWFGKGSRDLILHGCTDAHCKWALRRTALYRNAATRPGEVRYEFAGYFNYRGDPAMVPPAFEERPYDVYGSAVSLFPDAGDGKKRLGMSVDGKLYVFSDLGPDGLTFRTRKPLNLPARRNRCKGWQEVAVNVPFKVQHVRIQNDANGMGNLRDSFLHVVKFEALAGGKNHAAWDNIARFDTVTAEKSPWYHPQRPRLMFTPGNEPSDEQPNFTSFGYFMGPAVISFKQPVALEKIRFLLSEYEDRSFNFRLPFYWQGKLYHDGTEKGEPWYQYLIEVSADGKAWTKVADTLPTEMMRSFPYLIDWDGDGRVDLVLGVLNSRGIWPASKEYRLYRNQGTNDDPRFDRFEPFRDEKGKPLNLPAEWYSAYGIQCGVSARDLDGDGKTDLVVEGYGKGDLVFYRNVSADPKRELRFKAVKSLGDPRPIWYNAGYRYFFVGDVDGDGTPDLINCSGNGPVFFKGTPATAPLPAEDLAVVKSTASGVELRWTRPKGASAFEVRWAEEPVTEVNWPNLPRAAGTYPTSAGEGAAFAYTVTGLPAGKAVFIAVKSLNGRKQASPLSGSVEAAVFPLRQVVLRNGFASVDGVSAYSGCQACYLDAQKPGQVMPKQPSVLIARAQNPAPGADKQRVALVRFQDLPRDGSFQRATLELTTDPTLAPDPTTLEGLATLAVSCSRIRDNWDVNRATFAEAAPGKPWSPGELDAGGTFLSKAAPEFTVQPRRTLRWDVTEAVRAARQEGKDSVSLLVRVDYTGYYIGGLGYNFCGVDFPQADLRPRLRLTVR